MNDALADAAAQSAAAIDAGTADAHDHMILALATRETNPAQAARQIERALALEPENPSVLVGLAIIRHAEGRLREAALACDAAIARAPGYIDAWRERGAVLAAGGSNAEARRSFAEALRLDPADAGANAGLAALHAREGEAEDAERFARLALAVDPANLIAASALASAELTKGRPESVPPLLDPLLATGGSPSLERTLALSLLGDAWHKLGDPARAFASYAASKEDFRDSERERAADELTHLDFVEAITAGLVRLDTQAWPATGGEQPAKAPPVHVFLIGYPRSGTTLAENVLASLSDVAALEERPTMLAVDEQFLSGDAAHIGASLARFADLDEDQLAALRAAYWDKVETSLGMIPAAGFVDMDPLKATRLPFIARLFPNASILIMRRDPRDVVWSCFKTNFALTSGTLEYTSLERAARHYDAMMRLTELALAKLPVRTHIVPYHALVRDFEATTRAMCRFSGLAWEEAVFRFDKTALRRGVSTASVAQVKRGLYDGTRQWEPYARWLEPVMPILAPWIAKFGYAP